jgi:hypothetical protein
VLAVAATTATTPPSAFASHGNAVTIQRHLEHKSVTGSGNTVHQEHNNVIIMHGGGVCQTCD